LANGAPLGFESKLWAAADALRNNMDSPEYKHVVLGLIFLKYISDAFEAKHAELKAQKAQGADPEDPDEYAAARIFRVPRGARWAFLRANATQPKIGTIIDDAMSEIERDDPSLKGVLPRDFARVGLDKQRLGQFVKLVSDIALGSPAGTAKDTLGRVYEYFLAQLASAEGKKGVPFYTPSRVVRVLVEVRAPYKGDVYRPCCGFGRHVPQQREVSIYGQESNCTTWRLAKMNLAIRGIDAQIAHGDTVHAGKHPWSQSRLCAGQPAVQRQRLARRVTQRRQALGLWRAARRQRQLCLGAALHLPLGAHGTRGLRAGQWLNVVEPVE
jgi:type I restriction enzyme M protein